MVYEEWEYVHTPQEQCYFPGELNIHRRSCTEFLTCSVFPFCSVLDDSDTATSSVQRAATGKTKFQERNNSLFTTPDVFLPRLKIRTDILPEGLVRELPDEDSYVEPPAPASSGAIDDDLEELQRQLDALNSS